MRQKFDILVIGSGGGSKITRPAANLGYKVAIVDHGPLGGTCLNRGCIPSKMVIHTADVMSEIRDAQHYNIQTQAASVDVKALVDRVSAEVDGDSASIAPLYEAHENITYFKNTAEFISDTCVKVGEIEIEARFIFIVAGGRPHIPNISGLSKTPYWTSTEALRARIKPKSMIVLGGGYIATELGYYYQSIGTDVTFLVRSKMIKHEDHDVVESFERLFKKHHRVYLGEVPQRIVHDGQQFNVTLSTGELCSSEALLVATGITPNTDVLRLDRTSIKCDSRGYIQVDNAFETSVPSVFAFGDIIGRYAFRHSANIEGQHVFDSVVKNKQKAAFVYPPIPSAVFTNPQVASVGKTEQQCKQEELDYYVGMNSYKDSAMGMALRSPKDEFVKLIFDRETDVLIGAHVIGKEAATMIHMLILAITKKLIRDDLQSMVYIHPALPEVVRNAVRNAVI